MGIAYTPRSDGAGPPEQLSSELLPGGVPSLLPPGHRLVRGKGGVCWDQARQRYLDFVCGYGSVIVGHADHQVNSAIKHQLLRGILLSGPSPNQDELRNAICERLSFPSCLFLKTGSEAVAAAVRLARAYIGRPVIIRCGFHGWHGEFITPSCAWHTMERYNGDGGGIAGIPEASPYVVAWSGGDLEALETLFRRFRGQVAALLIDPVQLDHPIGQSLAAIREITRRHEALLVLDECKTALRVSPRCVQGLYDVGADMVIVGKSLGNGMPIAAVAGREEIIQLASVTKIMGTFNGELLSMAAALQVLKIFSSDGPTQHLWDLGERLIRGVNQIASRLELSERIRAVPYRWPCMPFLYFCGKDAARWRTAFFRLLSARHVLILSTHMSFLCFRHRVSDVDEVLHHVGEVLLTLKTRPGSLQ